MLTKQVVVPSHTIEVTFAEHVGTRIRQRRKQLGLTLDDVVASCDISKPFLSDIENGKRSIGFAKLYGLAKVLQRRTDWFANGWD